MTDNGTPRPRGTFIPPGYKNNLLALTDFIRFAAELFGPATFKTLLFHLERSLTYSKNADNHSFSQITGGIDNRKTGLRIRGSAGISKASFAESNIILEKLGILKRKTRFKENNACDATNYEVVWETLTGYYVKTITDKPIQKLDRPCPKARRRPGSKRDQGGTTDDSQTSSKPKTEPTKTAPDDETRKPKPHPVREPGATPEAEFLLRLEERHHTDNERELSLFELKEIIRQVCIALSDAGLTLSAFLELDARKTKGRLKNPPGYYRSLVTVMICERKTAIHETVMDYNRRANESMNPTPPEVPTGPKCPTCKEVVGRGVVIDMVNGQFAPCPACATEEFRIEWAEHERRRNEQAEQLKQFVADRRGQATADGASG